MIKVDDKKLLLRAPKIELHTHLEGSISLPDYQKLAEKNNIDSDSTIFNFTSFVGFFKAYGELVKCLQTAEDYYLIAKKFLEKQAKLNVIYTEFFVSITSWMHQDSWADEAISQISKAIKEVEKERNIKANMIIDINRGSSWDNNGLIPVDYAIKNKTKHVVGVGLGGDELVKPAKTFQIAFREAKKAGLRTCVHTGETGDTDSVKDTIIRLAPDRIGHGIAIKKDNKIIHFLKEKGVVLDICPTSENITGTAKIKQNPLRCFFDQGLPITIGSDDCGLFETDLVKELLILTQNFGFSIEEVKKITLSAVEASFATVSQKQTFRQKVNSFYGQVLRGFN